MDFWFVRLTSPLIWSLFGTEALPAHHHSVTSPHPSRSLLESLSIKSSWTSSDRLLQELIAITWMTFYFLFIYFLLSWCIGLWASKVEFSKFKPDSQTNVKWTHVHYSCNSFTSMPEGWPAGSKEISMYRGLCGQLEKASENKFSKLQTNLINVMWGIKLEPLMRSSLVLENHTLTCNFRESGP